MTVSKLTTFLFFLVLLCAARGVVCAQNAVCRVTAYSIDSSIPHSASFSDSNLVREFNLKLDGNFMPDPFEHKESGITVFVRVTRSESTLFSKEPSALKLTVQLFKGPRDSYVFYIGEADSIYDKNWRGASVSSHVRVDDYKGYTFTFACEKKEKKREEK